MKYFYLLSMAFALCLASLTSQAQHLCGFDQQHQHKLQTDPTYRTRVEAMEKNIRETASIMKLGQNQSNNNNAALYTIPVVVHIVHTGGALGTIYNPTDVQIQNTIDFLNAVYNGSHPSLELTNDIQIQFVLAKRDPNCNTSNGINHINGSSLPGYVANGINNQNSNGTPDATLKSFIRWDPSRYYNIYVVNKIDGYDGTSGSGVAGFAYFPYDSDADGTVILANTMKPTSFVLPHEIGHAFFLYHPFQGAVGNTCPVNTNCAIQGDQICDIDPVTQPANFVCRTGTNPCTGTAYTANSEHNIMNYTNCPALFTPDQKTRMLSAAGSIGRINLASSTALYAPDEGMTCAPRINFEITEAYATEATVTASGCRSYTDYTYNIEIGVAPSQNATATITVGGTATEGVDYDITTNGNFNAPSKDLSFPTGTNAARSFTVRIYNDQIVESAETIQLGFTVNAGGGNAVAGDGRPSLNIYLTDNDTAPHATQDKTYSFEGSSTILATSPFVATASKRKSQMLYKAAELAAAGVQAGNIKGIAFNIISNNTPGFTYQNVNIKIAATAQQHLVNSNIDNSINDASHTVVYSGNVSLTTGWNTFNFSTPFAWNGTSNLVVTLCYDNGVTVGVDDYSNLYTDASYGAQNGDYTSKTVAGCATALSLPGYYPNAYKPIVQFIAVDPQTPVQSTLNSSGTEYLGPFADVYFYDQTNQQLMARIQNLSNFNYGCTQVVIDRAGTGATAFWNNTTGNYVMDKTVRVLPTTNNPSGQYTITVYFNDNEVTGWEAATSQLFNNIQLVKVPGQILNVTPSNPNGGGGTPEITTPLRGTLGTSYSLSYTFNSGFSGFGAGIVGTALPVSITNFSGTLTNRNTVTLNWQTSSENNNSGFDIERSYDGNQYTKIGFVAGAGNSSTTQSYSFEDPALAQEFNYYRLKQVDNDHSFTYSNTVLVKSSLTNNGNFRVLTNPFNNYIDVHFGRVPGMAVSVRLLDLYGKVLFKQIMPKPAQVTGRIELGNTMLNDNNIYLLEVETDGKKYTQKVVKQYVR